MSRKKSPAVVRLSQRSEAQAAGRAKLPASRAKEVSRPLALLTSLAGHVPAFAKQTVRDVPPPPSLPKAATHQSVSL
ncbi:hypothetical protein [Paenibacillus polymyxa]|uniref:hypothetical protein n=1 Tax=Paenibacillus polymyxa TaxID=1406 RepID=UPI003D2E93AA